MYPDKKVGSMAPHAPPLDPPLSYIKSSMVYVTFQRVSLQVGLTLFVGV